MTLKEKIREIVREGYNYPDETTNKILKAIEESLPKKKTLEYSTQDQIYNQGFNQALKEVKEGLK